MGWKTWPYWLRGGIIVTLIWGILTIVLIPFGKPSGFFELFPYWAYPSLVSVLPINFLSHNFIKTLALTPILLIGSALCIYFLIGALIGWIYGRIKSR